MEAREVESRTAWAVLAAIVAASALLRLWRLGADSLWRDEAASWVQSEGGFTAVIVATARDNYPPLHNLILAAFRALLGDSEWVLRLPSVLAGVLAIVATYWIGVQVASRRAGLAAALPLALSGFHLWYSQEARMYGLLTLTAALFVGTSLRLLTRPSGPWAVAVWGSAVALLYTHAYGGITWAAVVVAVGAAAVIHRHEVRLSLSEWIGLQTLALVAFLPWAWVLLRRTAILAETGFWAPPPTFSLLSMHTVQVLDGPPMAALIGIGVVLMMLRPRPFGDAPPIPMGTTVVAAWALAPALVGLALSDLVFPMFIGRYVIGSLPAVLLLAGIGISRWATGRHFAAALVVVGFVAAASLVLYGPGPREDWRGAAQRIAAVGPVCVVTAGPYSLAAIRYYLRPAPDCMAIVNRSEQTLPQTLAADAAVLVLYGADLRSGGYGAAAFRAAGWRVAGEEAVRGMRLVRYER